MVHEKQLHRSCFVAILSNFTSTWVHIATFDENGAKIDEHPCNTLADAVIYAETSLDSQVKTTIPMPSSGLEQAFTVLAVGKHYFLLSVMKSTESEVSSHTSA